MKLDSDIKKNSYYSGYQIGKGIADQDIETNQDALLAGLKEGLAKNKIRLDADEIKAALAGIQHSMKTAQSEHENEIKSTGQEFLKKNALDPAVVVTASGLQYRFVKVGSGPKPNNQSRVKIHYTGYLIDGAKFDSSVDRKKAEFFEISKVMPGWREALLMMKTGSIIRIALPPALAFGPKGHPGIDPNMPVVYNIELLGIE